MVWFEVAASVVYEFLSSRRCSYFYFIISLLEASVGIVAKLLLIFATYEDWKISPLYPRFFEKEKTGRLLLLEYGKNFPIITEGNAFEFLLLIPHVFRFTSSGRPS